MTGLEVKMIILSTDNLDESIGFYSDTLGMALKFRGSALAAPRRRPGLCAGHRRGPSHPGQVVVGIKTADVDAAAKAIRGGRRRYRQGPVRRRARAPRRGGTTTRATGWSSTAPLQR